MEPRDAIVRIEPDSLGKVGDGLVVLARFQVGISSIVVVRPICLTKPDGLGEVGNRLVVLARLSVAYSPQRESIPTLRIEPRTLRIEPDGLRDVGDGLSVFPLGGGGPTAM